MFSFLTLGKGGTGKTTVLKNIAISWAEDNLLTEFNFVFLVSMDQVKQESKLEECIVDQHTGLKANKVTAEEIRRIMGGETEDKVLVLIDDHKRKINSDIDEAIQKNSLWHCWMLLTTRDSRHDFRGHMDVELEILGLEQVNIEKYITKSLGSKDKADHFLNKAQTIDLNVSCHDIFQTPIFLNIFTTLLTKWRCGVETKTKTLQGILNRFIDREVFRTNRATAKDDFSSYITGLERLAWIGLEADDRKSNTYTKVQNLSLTTRLIVRDYFPIPECCFFD